MPPHIDFIRDEDQLPDPYLLLGTAKQHLADHQPPDFNETPRPGRSKYPMDKSDMEAWEICDLLQRHPEVEQWEANHA